MRNLQYLDYLPLFTLVFKKRRFGLFAKVQDLYKNGGTATF
jgi:hypothetical protein